MSRDIPRCLCPCTDFTYILWLWLTFTIPSRAMAEVAFFGIWALELPSAPHLVSVVYSVRWLSRSALQSSDKLRLHQPPSRCGPINGATSKVPREAKPESHFETWGMELVLCSLLPLSCEQPTPLEAKVQNRALLSRHLHRRFPTWKPVPSNFSLDC
jgi:hypothetical protein